MVEVHNLNGSREVLPDRVPNPRGAIAERHFLFRPVPAPTMRFDAEASPKSFGRFDTPGVGGRVFLAHRSALRIVGGLREDTPQFDFPRPRLLALLPGPPLGF